MKGADILKEWDATLDSHTRPSHQAVDGEVKELEEAFSNGLMFPGDPSGPAREVCRCRCALLQRARWALGNGFSKMDSESGDLLQFIDEDDYKSFKKSYFEKSNKMANESKNDWSKTRPRNISKVEKEKIIKYAIGKGVKIVDLSKFDGNSDLLKEQIDTISKWKDYLPVKKAVTLKPDVMSDEDFGKTNNCTIKLQTKALRNREITNKNINDDINYFASSDISDISAHEYGHIFTKKNGINALEISKEAYYNIYGTYLEMEELLYFYRDNISTYSFEAGKGEFISEIFAKHNSNPNQFTEEIISILKKKVL